MTRIKEEFKKKRVLIPLALILIITVVIVYHSYKPLPDGVSYEGDLHQVEDVEFLYDLKYRDQKGDSQHDEMIFDEISKTIEEAEEFIVIDMFLFNGYVDEDRGFPTISGDLTNKIIEQKKKHRELEVVFISDEINTTYGSHAAEQLEELKENGVKVVITDIDKLRDPNPLYSGVWRTGLQWFGEKGYGWLPNPLAENAPKVTARSYLKLLNIKANHRKVIATEKAAIISSANPHDASGFHSNIAFKVKGNIIGDILTSEQAVSMFSGGPDLPKWEKKEEDKGEIAVQFLTEGKIYQHVLEELDRTKSGDNVWLGMFYLADTQVLEALKEAAGRDVKINMILDPNQNAFGQDKIGLPNLPVAAELEKLGENNIKIRWYDTQDEQYHSKFMYIDHGDEEEAVIIGGSANYTERNLNDYNIEANLKISANKDEKIVQEVEEYFERLWTNKDGVYTVDYSEYQEDLPVFKYIAYLLQKLFKVTTY